MLAASDEEMKAVFSSEDTLDLLLATGFRNPTSSLTLQDRDLVVSTLKDYYCITKVYKHTIVVLEFHL